MRYFWIFTEENIENSLLGNVMMISANTRDEAVAEFKKYHKETITDVIEHVQEVEV